MMTKSVSNLIGISVCLLLFHMTETIKAESSQMVSSFIIPDQWTSSVQNVASQIKFPELHESNLYRLGTTVDESVLSNPETATRKSQAIGKSGCKDTSWVGGSFSFNADFVVNNPEPLPTELPEERRLSLIKQCQESGKTEMETNEYLEKTLESYRKSKEKIVKGQLEVRIVNAPSVKAAFEYLILDATVWTSVMPEMIISYFDEQCTNNFNLGTIAYCRGGVVRFIRDNIAVVIRADGEFNQEAIEIAKKIDALLLEQPLCTREQLQARCPTLHISPGGKIPETGIPLLDYSVEVPAGAQAWMREIKINGQGRSMQDHKIFLEEKPKKAQIEATVVSNELLVSTFNMEIEIPE